MSRLAEILVSIAASKLRAELERVIRKQGARVPDKLREPLEIVAAAIAAALSK